MCTDNTGDILTGCIKLIECVHWQFWQGSLQPLLEGITVGACVIGIQCTWVIMWENMSVQNVGCWMGQYSKFTALE